MKFELLFAYITRQEKNASEMTSLFSDKCLLDCAEEKHT